MSTIKVTVTGTSPGEIRNKFLKLAEEWGVFGSLEKSEPTVEAQKTEDSGPVQTESATDEAPPTFTAPSADIVAVRSVLTPLVEAGRGADVKALLQRFGADKLTDIPDDKLGDVLDAAKELSES